MVFVDVHSHLDFKHFDNDRDDIVNLMREKNIFTLTNTISFSNYKYTKKLFEKDSDVVRVCPGLYPVDAQKISEEEFEEFLAFLRENSKKFVAIGEVGLDKHEEFEEELFKVQVERFKRIVEVAVEIDKPLIIHSRKAEREVLEILEFYVREHNFRKFVVHCFTGKKALMQKIRDLKIYCSIPMIVLNTQSFVLLVNTLKINQILVETDSPFLNPDKSRNSPLNVPLIYEKIALLKGYDKKEIENIIYRNYMRVFM